MSGTHNNLARLVPLWAIRILFDDMDGILLNLFRP